MNTLNHILLAATCMLSSVAFAGDSFEKEWKKEYTANADATFKLKSKFSRVTITTWDKPTMSVLFKVEVDINNEARAQKMLDAITVKELSSTASLVSLETIFKEKKMDDVEITYTIQLPKTVHIDLKNDFGDNFIGTTNGTVTVDIDYGNLRGESFIAQNNVLNMDFSNAEIDAFVEGEVNISYGNLEIDKVGVMRLKSSFSSFEFDEAGLLDIKSSYDGFELDEVSTIKVAGSFSSFEIDRLITSIDAVMDYGNFEVDFIAAAFDHVDIQADFSAMQLNFEKDASYLLDAEAMSGSIEGPRNMNTKPTVSEDGRHHTLKGEVGSSVGKRTVTLRSSQGMIEIDQ